MGIFRSTTKSQFGEILEENSDLTVNTDFGNSSEIPCFLHHWAWLEYKIIDPPPPPPPGTGPDRVNIPSPEETKIRLKGPVKAYCKCDNDGEWTDRFGRTQGTGKCDDEGWNDFLYTKTMKTKWDCEDAPKNDGTAGVEQFCGGKTERRICKDFPLSDVLPTPSMGSGGDQNYFTMRFPASKKARQKCNDDYGDESGGSGRYEGFAPVACGVMGAQLLAAAEKCGAEIIESVDLGPISDSGADKWKTAVITQKVKDCMLDELACGGDSDAQAAVLTVFLANNFFKEKGSGREDNAIFPPHDCELGDCLWDSSACYDDEEDCKKKK